MTRQELIEKLEYEIRGESALLIACLGRLRDDNPWRKAQIERDLAGMADRLRTIADLAEGLKPTSLTSSSGPSPAGP